MAFRCSHLHTHSKCLRFGLYAYRSSRSAHSRAQLCPSPHRGQPGPLPSVCPHGTLSPHYAVSSRGEPHSDFIWCGTCPPPSPDAPHPSCSKQYDHCIIKPTAMDALAADVPSHPSPPPPPSPSSLHSRSVSKTSAHHTTGSPGEPPSRTESTASPTAPSVHPARIC